MPEGTPLNKQLLNFQQHSRRSAFVVDEYGDVQGLITTQDIIARSSASSTLSERGRHRRHEGERPQLRRRRERERPAAESRDELESADRRAEDAERPDRRAARDDPGDRHRRHGRELPDRDPRLRASTASNACASSRRDPLRRRRSPPEARVLSRPARTLSDSRSTGSTSMLERPPRRIRARHERALEPMLLRLRPAALRRTARAGSRP